MLTGTELILFLTKKKARSMRAFSIGMCGDTVNFNIVLVPNNLQHFLSAAHNHHSTECCTTNEEEQHA